MNTYFSFRNKILLAVFASSLAVAAFCALMGHGFAAVSLLTGSLLGGLNFYLLAKEIARFQPDHQLNRAVPNLMRTSGLRFLILILGMGYAVTTPWFFAPTFIVGLFLTQMVIFGSQFTKNPFMKA